MAYRGGRGGRGGRGSNYQNPDRNQHQNNQSHRNNQSQQDHYQTQPSGNTIQLAVKGWNLLPSKFANDPASGEEAFVTWLKNKSKSQLQSHKFVGKSRLLLVDIDASDLPKFQHINGWEFSRAKITIEESRGKPGPSQNQNQQNDRTPLAPRGQNQQTNVSNVPSGPRGQRNNDNGNYPSGPRTGADLIPAFNSNTPFFNNSQTTFGSSNNQTTFGQNRQTQQNSQPQKSREPSEKQQLEDLMASIIRKRYNAGNLFLTFEALSKDADIQGSALVDATAGKVWGAFFTMCENKVFETPAKRREMVQSVSLAHNSLDDVKDVIALSATFPQLKNLDLSNNNIKNAGDLRFWRNSFRSLEHLVLLNNPIMNEPAELQKVSRWYRTLKMLNNDPLQPNGMALDAAFPNRTASPAPPLPGITSHPEVDITTFGQPMPGKDEETLMKERMGLQFSVDTHLKMQYVEMCLGANGFNYDAAMANLRMLFEQGQVPADAFLG